MNQSKYCNLKTTSSPDDLVNFIRHQWPTAAVVWCCHDKDTPVVHHHFVVRFDSATRWDKLRQYLMAADPHSYSATARSWSRSVRYLVHADNPEKYQYPPSSVQYSGIDEDEINSLLGGKTGDAIAIFNALGSFSDLPVGSQFCQLVGMGFRPAEITCVVRCLSALRDFNEKPFLSEKQESSPSPVFGFAESDEGEDSSVEFPSFGSIFDPC